MKKEKNILNKRGIIIIGVLLGTLLMFTGCGKTEISVKTYDKENEVEVSRNEDKNNYTVENEINDTKKYEEANKEIREVLRDRNWLKDNELYYEIDDGYKVWEANLYFIKINDIKGMPAYLVKTTVMDTSHTKLISYKDGKVYVSKNYAGGDYADQTVDVNRNIILSENQSVDFSTYYQIDGYDIKEIEMIEDYEEAKEKNKDYNFVEINTELTEENIDRYVK